MNEIEKAPELIKLIITAGSPIGVTLILWKSGVLGALASRWKKNGDDRRITELQDFKEEAENNHFHELNELKKDNEKIWMSITSLRRDLSNFQSKVSEEVGYLKGKINGQDR